MRGEFGIEVAEDSDANGLAHASIVLEGAIGSDYLPGAKPDYFVCDLRGAGSAALPRLCRHAIRAQTFRAS